jgi:hypothetical protein
MARPMNMKATKKKAIPSDNNPKMRTMNQEPKKSSVASIR